MRENWKKECELDPDSELHDVDHDNYDKVEELIKDLDSQKDGWGADPHFSEHEKYIWRDEL